MSGGRGGCLFPSQRIPGGGRQLTVPAETCGHPGFSSCRKLLAKLASVCDSETLVFSSLYVWAAPAVAHLSSGLEAAGTGRLASPRSKAPEVHAFGEEESFFFSFFLEGRTLLGISWSPAAAAIFWDEGTAVKVKKASPDFLLPLFWEALTKAILGCKGCKNIRNLAAVFQPPPSWRLII